MKTTTPKIAIIAIGCAILVACGDSNTSPPDARVSPDASLPKPDSPVPVADASLPIPDASLPVPDVSLPIPDAALSDAPDAPGTDPTLVLDYAFEETGTNVVDSSSQGKDGTLSDPTARTDNGRVGHALSLTNPATPPATQFVSLPNGVFTGVTDFTITAWVKLNANPPWARLYDIGNGMADPDNHFMFFSPSGFLGPKGVPEGVGATSFGGSPANEIQVYSTTLLPTGVWKHVAVSGSHGVRTLYIDGYPVQTITTTLDVPPSEMEPISPNSWLGKSRFPADAGADASFDEFRIYSRVLTQPEIADLAWPQTDYSYWRFDEGSGTTAKDSSDNAIPTALSTGVTWVPGKLGKAIHFPGGPAGATGPTVTLAKNPLASCSNEFTISVWVQLHSLDASTRVFDFGTNQLAYTYLAPADVDGKLHFAMGAAGTFLDLTTAGATPFAADDTFHHVAVTYTLAKLVTIYFDGVSVASQSTAISPSVLATLSEIWLGKSRVANPYLNGALDELRIGCRALTADEIKNLAQP